MVNVEDSPGEAESVRVGGSAKSGCDEGLKGPGLAWAGIQVWFVVWFAVGCFVVGSGIKTPFGPWADVIFLALAGALLWRLAEQALGWKLALGAFGWVAVVSGLVESLGAQTGWPFGAYSYTGAFGPRLLGVLPFSIPVAWWLVVMGGYCLCLRLVPRGMREPWRSVALITSTGGLAVWVDLVLEPVAWGLRGYWIWEEASFAPGEGFYYGVPAANFAGWFGLAVLIAAGLRWLFPRPREERLLAMQGDALGAALLLAVVLTFLAAMPGIPGPAIAIAIALSMALVSVLVARRRRWWRLWLASLDLQRRPPEG